MGQGVLGYQYEAEGRQNGMTGLAGLLLYLDLAEASSLWRSLDQHLKVRAGKQGWTDSQIVMSLILLNLAGGDCVEDLRVLEADEGFGRVLRRVEGLRLSRRERREGERRFRRERSRAVPSPSSVFRYLSAFHDEAQERLRVAGRAFIPAPSEPLSGLIKVQRDFLHFVQSRHRAPVATLDMDATLVETSKREALYSYKHFLAYQPLNVWWAEQGMFVYTEFRDGNVPAGFEQLRVLKESLEVLPPSVEKVRLRSDSAGYQHELLSYCERGEHPRFGRIEFAVSADVTVEFRQAMQEVPESSWQPLYRQVGLRRMETGQQWAEVCFVPNAIGHSKKGPQYRYLAIREALCQRELPGVEGQRSLPFTPVELGGERYKVSGVVTNLDWGGEAVIHWLRERCGKSEEAHSVMKEDLAGGKLPSGRFGENAAWWWIMVLSFNLNAAMKRLVLKDGWVSKRMKALRFGLIQLPGRILEHARQLRVRLCAKHPSLGLLVAARGRILTLAQGPAG
jgi:hypothetical protein